MPCLNIPAPAVSESSKPCLPAGRFKVQSSKFIKFFIFLFLIIIVGQWLYSIGRILFNGVLFDFGYYLRAVQNVSSGVNPYFAENFVYPLPVLFIFYPFSFLPLFWSQILWTVFSLLFLITSIIYIIEVTGKKKSLFQVILIVPLILLSFPVRWTFGLGQINLLLLFFIVLTYFFAVRKKDFWSGVCLGVAVVLKLTPFFLVFYFLIKKRFKITIVSLLTIVTLLFFSGIVFGFDLAGDYFKVVVPQLFEPATKHVYYNQAFSGLSAGFISNEISLTIVNFLFAAIIVLIDLWIFLKTKLVNALDYSLTICSMLLINGFSWQHHFALLIFPFLVLFKATPCQSKGWPYKRILFVLCYLLVSFNFKQPELLGDSFPAKIALAHVFWGTLLLWGILISLISSSSNSSGPSCPSC